VRRARSTRPRRRRCWARWWCLIRTPAGRKIVLLFSKKYFFLFLKNEWDFQQNVWNKG
jgi:hypothetical protein